MLLGANVYSQNTINGNVTDENGTPLPGATILNLETSQGSTSDFNGEFSIEASEGSTLSVQYVGYSSQEIQVSDNLITCKSD